MKLTQRGRWACLWVTAAGTLALGALCLPLPDAGMSLPPCATDSPPFKAGGCSWDASERGNGAGADFWVMPSLDGTVCYTYPGHSDLNVCIPPNHPVK